MGLSRQCRRLREWLPEYAEGKLSARRRAAVELHLAACARCRQEVADLCAVLASLHRVEQEAVPAHVLAGIRTALRQPAGAAARRPSSLWARLAVPAVAATGLVAIAFVLHQEGLPRQGASPAVGAEPVPAAGVVRRAKAPATLPAAVDRRMPERTPRGRLRPRPEPPRDQVMHRGRPQGQQPLSAKEAIPRRGSVQLDEKADEAHALAAPPGAPEAEERGALVPPAPAESPPARAAGGGGGGLGGGRRGDGTTTRLEPRGRRITRRGPYQGRYGRGGYPPGRRGGLSRARGAPTAAAADRSAAAARPPAQAVVVRTERGQAIMLRLEPSLGRTVKVYAGNQVVQPGKEAPAGRVVLPAESLGAVPAQTPITISSEAGDWKFTLFTPGAAQLGRQQSMATKRYQQAPLAQVLADLSAESGLVLLVEGRTDSPVEGELPLASPKEAVERLAEAAKLQVYTEDGLVYTLRPQR